MSYLSLNTSKRIPKTLATIAFMLVIAICGYASYAAKTSESKSDADKLYELVKQARADLDALRAQVGVSRTHVESRREGRGEHGEGGREGRGEHGERREGRGEHGEKREGRGEHPEGREGGESHEEGEGHEGEGDGRSSPIVPLGRSYEGVIDGLEAKMSYNPRTQSVTGTVKNVTSKTMYSVQTEHHLKRGKRTVGEMRTEKIGNIAPGETKRSTSFLRAKDKERLSRKGAFDGYVVHLEVLGPNARGEGHEGGREGRGEHSEGRRESRGESHEGRLKGRGEHGEGRREGRGERGEGREGRGEHGERREGRGEHGEGGEEGGEGGLRIRKNAKWNKTRNGAHLILAYNAGTQSFKGTVQNTTSRTLSEVRVEIHLSNGAELGPTKRIDLKPGQKIPVELSAANQRFTWWTTHPEHGSEEGHGPGHEGEGGNEHGKGDGRRPQTPTLRPVYNQVQLLRQEIKVISNALKTRER